MAARLKSCAVVVVLLAGCTYHSSGGAPGSVVFHMPGTVPATLPTPALPAIPQAPQSGRYAGTGQLTFNPGARAACRDTIPLTDFSVDDNRVRFGGFRGTIDADGRLDMQAGHRFLSGHFAGSTFQGRLWQPPPSCTYTLTLNPVG